METSEPLSKCADCGKLFGARPGKIWCSACSTKRVDECLVLEDALDEGVTPTPEALAARTGLPLERVKHLIRTSPGMKGSMEAIGVCVRCRQEPAERGSDFCPKCREELDQAFGAAAKILFAKFPPMEHEPFHPDPEQSLGLVTTLQEKRSHSGPSLEEIAPTRGLL